MFELIILGFVIWLLGKTLGLALRVSWSLAKAVALGLFALALPVFLGCVAVLGGLALLAPVVMIGASWQILKHC